MLDHLYVELSLSSAQATNTFAAGMNSKVVRAQMRIFRAHRALAVMLWSFALAAGFALPYGAAHGGAAAPSLEVVFPVVGSCQNHLDPVPRCAPIDHSTDHQALPQSGKVPFDGVVSTTALLAAVLVARTYPTVIAEFSARQAYLLIHRLQL